jgi:hypothetical protein
MWVLHISCRSRDLGTHYYFAEMDPSQASFAIEMVTYSD